jgi:hypothetical protein
MVKKVHNWGIYPVIDADVISVKYPESLPAILAQNSSVIAQGNGRCYGDSSLNSTMISTLAMNKILSFDKINGHITCQSGVLLSDILQVIVPAGYFLPVTPGTKFITVGGAIAADIHGKNHHADGCFSNHIIRMSIMQQNGDIVTCNATTHTDIFRQTCGGMGLTGIIMQATFSLKKIETSYISQKSLKAANLEEIMDYFAANEHYTYSVAWIDCLAKGDNIGKSILMLGEHSTLSELDTKRKANPLYFNDKTKVSVPFYFPSFTLNALSIKAFNFLYYHKQFQKEVSSQIHYEPYFYPLDAILHWNKIYGKNGFTQYQFVLPMDGSRQGLNEILKAIADSGEGSFLAVLKLFGEADKDAIMSFPSRGYTLALDFKISPKVLQLLNKLDDIVLHFGGRLYLAKDARMSKEFFHKTYDKIVQRQEGFGSLQSQRLAI